WTSGAENSNWIFLLVRTNHDVQQQKGISFLLADMNTRGVTVQPLYAFNGKRLWNHVFFDDVRVPMSLRLGEEDQGWTVAKSLLGDERLFVSRVAENKRILSVLKDTTTEMTHRGVSLPDSLMAEMAGIEVRLHALEMTSLRVLTEADSGGQIGAEPSMLKLKGSQLIQDQDEIWFRLVDHLSLAMDTKGSERTPLGPAFAEYVASGRYHHRGYTIAGGSSEVQQNIIAKQVLSL
ncbi:MAG: alkylation response protein AidB-like acyl-CoA dehydrogenase, partial [Candidatus Azotimanducaceae bacterium]